MKTIFYICLMLGALLLPASKGIRDATISLIKSVASSIERLVIRGDYAEVRIVDADEFEMTINEPGRVVIVVFQSGMAESSTPEKREFDDTIKSLPGKVLVAKVMANSNASLLKRLNVNTIPTIMIYSRGEMVRSYKGTVDKDDLVATVNQCLDSSPKVSQKGYVGPMKKDWLPPGVQTTSGDNIDAPMTPLDTGE